MINYLYEWLRDADIPGWGMLPYISFLSAAANITTLLITMGFGKRLIGLLQKKQN
ncbi:MAG: hypothetical protein AB7D05_00775 [Mangrovibacterium sp.]